MSRAMCVRAVRRSVSADFCHIRCAEGLGMGGILAPPQLRNPISDGAILPIEINARVDSGAVHPSIHEKSAIQLELTKHGCGMEVA